MQSPCLGEAGATLTVQRKEIQEGASPRASAPGWGDGLGGRGCAGSLKLPRRAEQTQGPEPHICGSHQSPLPKTQASSPHLEPGPCPTTPATRGPKILEPGHQPCPSRTRLPRAQTPREAGVASFSLTPPNTGFSHHQFQIGRKPKKVPAKLSQKCWAGQGPERSGAQSWVGWVRWGGQAEKRPFESRSRETTALPPPTSLP